MADTENNFTGEIPGNGIDDDGNGVVDDVHGYRVMTDCSSGQCLFFEDGDVDDDNGMMKIFTLTLISTLAQTHEQ